MGVYSTTMRYTGLSGIDTDSMVQSLMNAESLKYNKLVQDATKLQYTQDAYREQANNLKSFQSSQLDILSATSIRSSSTLNAKQATITMGGAASTAVTISNYGSGNNAVGAYDLQITQLAQKDAYVGTKANGMTDDKLKADTTTLADLGFTDNDNDGKVDFSITLGSGDSQKTVTVSVDKDLTLQDAKDAINASAAAVKMTVDPTRGTYRIDSTGTGLASAINLDGDGTEAGDNFAKLLGDFGLDSASGAERVYTAQDAEYKLNGVTGTSSTNDINVNGMNVHLNSVTGGTLSINVSQDTSAAMDAIQKFVDAYNTLVSQLTTAVTTSRPKSDSYTYYEPLTDDQKKDMSDDDIKAWDDKAKQGFLYNDSILGNVLDQMRSMLYQPVDTGRPAVDSNGQPTGKNVTISLYEIGITTTSDLTKSGQLTIDTTKLQAALQTRGDDVSALFNKQSDIALNSTNANGTTQNAQRMQSEGIADRLNDIVNLATSPLYGSITAKAGYEGDTQDALSLQLKDYATQKSDMMTYLANKETYYYDLFSKMEAAVTDSNNQMAQLQSMMS